MVYRKFTRLNSYPQSDLTQAPQRLVYVSQKCFECSKYLTPSPTRFHPDLKQPSPSRPCTLRRRKHPAKAPLTPDRPDRHLRASLFWVFRRGSGSGPRPGPARQVHAQGPHGARLGHQRLRHQSHAVGSQHRDGVLRSPLAPVSLATTIQNSLVRWR